MLPLESRCSARAAIRTTCSGKSDILSITQSTADGSIQHVGLLLHIKYPKPTPINVNQHTGICGLPLHYYVAKVAKIFAKRPGSPNFKPIGFFQRRDDGVDLGVKAVEEFENGKVLPLARYALLCFVLEP
eukprot:g9599.t1